MLQNHPTALSEGEIDQLASCSISLNEENITADACECGDCDIGD